MILRVLVYLPYIKLLLARSDVFHGEHRRHHRVVLVVVLVHPVAAHEMEPGVIAGERLPDDLDVSRIVSVVDRVRLALPYDTAATAFLGGACSSFYQLPLCNS